MSAAGKLAAFAALLLLVFGGAAAVGGAIGPDRDGSSAEAGADGMDAHGDEAADEDEMGGHGGDAEGGGRPDPVRGLAVAEGGLELALEGTELERGRRSELRFSILGSDGEPVRDFEVEHEKRMHLIVVRRDGEGFQHLHPELGGDGAWRVALTLPDAGAYRVFADFKRDGAAHTLAADLTVDGEAGYSPPPAPAATADAGDGYRVELEAGSLRVGREAELRFTVSQDGRPVRTEQYLGAGGHLVALREGDLAYLHVHPEAHGRAVAFATEFPSAAGYRLYLQFKHEGRVRTAEFAREVGR